MIRRPPRSPRTDTLFPYTTLFRAPTVREVAKFLEHIRWLKSLGHGLPDTREMAVTKRHQLMLEARALDAKDIRTVKLIKRHTLAVLLIQSQLKKATDDVRSEWRRVVKACVRTFNTRLSPLHKNKTS